jgi:hypothetical protein
VSVPSQREGRDARSGSSLNKSARKGRKSLLRCVCQHPKSIHARMYANQKLGTPCNFPGCRCKAYRAG